MLKLMLLGALLAGSALGGVGERFNRASDSSYPYYYSGVQDGSYARPSFSHSYSMPDFSRYLLSGQGGEVFLTVTLLAVIGVLAFTAAVCVANELSPVDFEFRGGRELLTVDSVRAGIEKMWQLYHEVPDKPKTQ